jgi:hypothetical protein
MSWLAASCWTFRTDIRSMSATSLGVRSPICLSRRHYRAWRSCGGDERGLAPFRLVHHRLELLSGQPFLRRSAASTTPAWFCAAIAALAARRASASAWSLTFFATPSDRSLTT